MADAAPAAPDLRVPRIRVIDCHIVRRTAGSLDTLLLKRAPGRQYAGTWRMVGGKIKPGETAWRACVREVAEETQLKVAELWVVPYINRFYEWKEDRINDIPVFAAVVTDGQTPVLDSEHTDWEWFPVEKAIELLPWPGQKNGLRAAETLLTKDESLRPYLHVTDST